MVLAVFQGPPAYISPSNSATKQETGKVVPTWNDAIVQARGIMGVEIEIAAIEGKWKVSLNRQEAERRGVAEGLAKSHEDMAALVRR
jgi:transcriptional regulator